MTRPVAKLANGQPAWTRETPRKRQSEIDATGEWAQSDVRCHRHPAEPRGLLWRLRKKRAEPTQPTGES